MFANAVEKAEKYTRPLHIVRRFFKTDPGDKERFYRQTAALFFVNDEGVAITCKHIANTILEGDKRNIKYNKYREEIKGKTPEEIKKIEEKYRYTENSDVLDVQYIRLWHKTVDPVYPPEIIKHDTCDLAILKFKNFEKKLYSSHAVFAADSSRLRPGNLMCIYGYPFPDYNNYTINEKDDLDWSSVKDWNITQPFPQMLMYARRVKSKDNVSCYEFNAPCYKGHSGGPVFDKDGIVYGINFQVKHYNSEYHNTGNYISGKGQKIEYNEHHFCHCARAIDADIIKKFLDENGIKYYVEQEEKLPDGRIIIGERAVLPKVGEHK